MTMNFSTIYLFISITYIVAGALQALQLFGQMKLPRAIYFVLTLFALLGHGWVLYKFIETPQGQNLNWLIMLTFTLGLMNLLTILTALRVNIENLCVLTYPISAASILIAAHFGGFDVVNTKSNPGMLAHIFISFMAISLLLLASLQAILIGIQSDLLKRRIAFSMLRILPPLQTMETLMFHIVLGGVLFLSGSLLSGFFSQQTLHFVWSSPKIWLALCAWALLVFLLVGHFLFGWRGKTALRWTLSGTTLTLLSYFGTKAFLL